MGILQNTHWTTVNWKQVNNSESNNKPAIGKTIIAVTHGGTLTHIYNLFLGVDLDKVPHIGNAATHVFNLTEEKGKIKGIHEK